MTPDTFVWILVIVAAVIVAWNLCDMFFGGGSRGSGAGPWRNLPRP
jgi:hypothetical protein